MTNVIDRLAQLNTRSRRQYPDLDRRLPYTAEYKYLKERRSGLFDRRGHLKNAIRLRRVEPVQHKRLLIIERNPSYAKALRDTLIFSSRPLPGANSSRWRWHPTDITVACNKSDVIDCTLKHSYQAIFVNIDNDFTFKIAFLQKVQEEWPDTKVIVSTANTSIMHLTTLKECGIKQLIIEPFRFNQFKQMLTE